MRNTILNEDGNEIITFIGTLEENKKEAFASVSSNFMEIGRTNTFMSSFGFEIDNRWVEKNDIDNATCAIDTWFEKQTVAYYRDTNDISHTLTFEELVQLKKEAQRNRLYQLSLKWRREVLIERAETMEAIWFAVEALKEEIDAIIPF